MGRWSRQERLAGALVAFAVAVTVLLLVPPALKGDVGSLPGFTWQEATDLFTPLIVMPLIALVVELAGRSELRVRLGLLILIAAWVEGHGLHLGANAIGDVFQAGSDRELFYATAPGPLDHFLDEVLGHWLWHGAWVGLLALVLWAGASGATERLRPSRLALGLGAFAGLVHGFTWFVVTDEGATWAMSIPASAALLALAILVTRRDGSWRVTTTFIFVSGLVSLALYAGWIALQGWPPIGFCDRFGC